MDCLLQWHPFQKDSFEVNEGGMAMEAYIGRAIPKCDIEASCFGTVAPVSSVIKGHIWHLATF